MFKHFRGFTSVGLVEKKTLAAFVRGESMNKLDFELLFSCRTFEIFLDPTTSWTSFRDAAHLNATHYQTLPKSLMHASNHFSHKFRSSIQNP